MGFYEDDRIRSKNAKYNKSHTEVVCDNCKTEFDNEEVKGDEDEPCPKCGEKALYIPG